MADKKSMLKWVYGGPVDGAVPPDTSTLKLRDTYLKATNWMVQFDHAEGSESFGVLAKQAVKRVWDKMNEEMLFKPSGTIKSDPTDRLLEYNHIEAEATVLRGPVVALLRLEHKRLGRGPYTSGYGGAEVEAWRKRYRFRRLGAARLESDPHPIPNQTPTRGVDVFGFASVGDFVRWFPRSLRARIEAQCPGELDIVIVLAEAATVVHENRQVMFRMSRARRVARVPVMSRPRELAEALSYASRTAMCYQGLERPFYSEETIPL